METKGRMQKQIELIIGSENITDFEREIFLKEISKLCGGCTLIKSEGYWIEEAGEQRLETYDNSKLEKEQTIHIKLTTELNKFDRVYKGIKEILQDMKTIEGGLLPDVTWVHCCVSDIVGLHIKV